MNVELVEWQRIGNDGLIECWFTHPCLDWINKQDWKEKNILMFGAGMGDASLAKKCKHLTVIERNEEWIYKAAEYAGNNGVFVNYIHRPCDDCSGKSEYYCEIPDGRKYDIIINDDAYRYEVCEMAINYFKKTGGGVLIADNWMQSYVWLSPKSEEILSSYNRLIFEQKDHTDNDGVNKWKTAIFFIVPNPKPKQKITQKRIEVSNLNVPNEWQIKSDWGSHLPLLYFTLENLKKGITEIGSGVLSTPALDKYTHENNILFESYETNEEYYTANKDKLINSQLIKSYKNIRNIQPIVFIDCAPGELRRDLINRYKDVAEVIVAHDTQPSAEYVYGMGRVLSNFKYRIDYVSNDLPMTTAVSNIIDITQWITQS